LVIAAAAAGTYSEISHSKTLWKIIVVKCGIAYGYAAE
jgi:hypothetical protein